MVPPKFWAMLLRPPMSQRESPVSALIASLMTMKLMSVRGFSASCSQAWTMDSLVKPEEAKSAFINTPFR